MNKQRFKEFLRMLDSEVLEFTDVYFGESIVLNIEHGDTDLDLITVKKHGTREESTRYKQWLNEVKQERGL